MSKLNESLIRMESICDSYCAELLIKLEGNALVVNYDINGNWGVAMSTNVDCSKINKDNTSINVGEIITIKNDGTPSGDEPALKGLDIIEETEINITVERVNETNYIVTLERDGEEVYDVIECDLEEAGSIELDITHMLEMRVEGDEEENEEVCIKSKSKELSDMITKFLKDNDMVIGGVCNDDGGDIELYVAFSEDVDDEIGDCISDCGAKLCDIEEDVDDEIGQLTVTF